MRVSSLVALVSVLWGLAGPGLAQRIEVRPATTVEIPFQIDGNSPTFWRDGRFTFLTSTGVPVRSDGADQFGLAPATKVSVDRSDHLPMWFEAAWVDADGTVYAWYHNEPAGVCSDGKLTAPRIGAAVSYDGGATFFDLGLLLVSGDTPDCSSKNGFFAGGHGDFSVVLDRQGEYFYFLFTNYGGDPAGQGVAVARLAFDDRRMPAGAVWKYYQGGWNEPGLGGRVTPIFPAETSWQRSDTNSFWGPAVHWNTTLKTYVVLMNHACCKPGWPQEGIYASFNTDLSNPLSWTTPTCILRDIPWAPGYYPEVIGLGPGETDTLVGQTARLYVQGRSKWELVFTEADLSNIGSATPEPSPDNPLDGVIQLSGRRLEPR